jgi:integrase
MKIVPKPEIEFAGDKAAIEWLLAQKLSTMRQYRVSWRLFKAFTGLNGDAILADREDDKKAKWEKKVLEFKTWLATQKTQTGELFSENFIKNHIIAAQSFFAYHRKPLIFRTQESSRFKKAKPKYEDFKFTRENLQNMANLGDLQGKYVIVAGKSFGLRIGDFLNLRRGDLEPYLKLPVPISIEAYTQKEGVDAYPFIDSDALPIIQAMISEMNRQGRTAPEEKMLQIKETQANNIIKKLTALADVNVGTKRVRFHCLRKFLCDRLASHMDENKWKQIVGKQIDEKAYISSDLLREPYQRAMADTCFESAPRLTHKEVELIAKKERLKAIAIKEGYTDEEISYAIRQQKDVPEVEVLEKLAANPKKLASGGLNFEQRAEEALAKIILGAIKKVKEDQA